MPSSLLYTFDIDLSDADRSVYEQLSLRVPLHPSETAESLLARVLAYCLELTEGLAFGRGLAEPDEPALAPRVVVYTHKDPATLLRQLQGERIHRAEALELHSLDRELLAALAARLQRR